MRSHLITVCLACLAVPTVVTAQTPAAPPSRSPLIYPVYSTTEGQPIDPRPPEKSDDKPLFPEQTRAPYHATAPFTVTTLTSALHAPWALAVLPDQKILVTERLPGAFRIVNQQGVLSDPLPGLSGLSSDPETGLLDVVLDPHFAANHRIFFTFFGYSNKTMGNTNVARARLDNGRLTDVQVIFRSAPASPNGPNLAAGAKSGGRIAIGHDGNLFVVIGDRNDAGATPWDVAQKLDTDLGKVIRITPDGKPAPGNPFTRHAWSASGNLGHRPAQPGRPGVRSGNRSIVGDRTWSPRWRRTEPHRERKELRLAGDHPRHRLLRRSRWGGYHRQRRHGATGVLLGSDHRSVRPGLLSGQIYFRSGRTASLSEVCGVHCSTGLP